MIQSGIYRACTRMQGISHPSENEEHVKGECTAVFLFPLQSLRTTLPSLSEALPDITRSSSGCADASKDRAEEHEYLKAQYQHGEGSPSQCGGGAWERPVVIGPPVSRWVGLDRDVAVYDADDWLRRFQRGAVNRREIRLRRVLSLDVF